MNEKVRIDKWLWAARFFKTRSLARDAIKGGKVQLNGSRVKPGKTVEVDDRLTVRRGEDEYTITVKDTGDRRVSAPLALERYEEDRTVRPGGRLPPNSARRITRRKNSVRAGLTNVSAAKSCVSPSLPRIESLERPMAAISEPLWHRA